MINVKIISDGAARDGACEKSRLKIDVSNIILYLIIYFANDFW